MYARYFEDWFSINELNHIQKRSIGQEIQLPARNFVNDLPAPINDLKRKLRNRRYDGNIRYQFC